MSLAATERDLGSCTHTRHYPCSTCKYAARILIVEDFGHRGFGSSRIQVIEDSGRRGFRSLRIWVDNWTNHDNQTPMVEEKER
jgi:hypothetical protein